MTLDLQAIYQIFEDMRVGRSSHPHPEYDKISPLISREELRKYHHFLMDRNETEEKKIEPEKEAEDIQARLDDESSRLAEIKQIILDAFQKRYSAEVYKELEKLVSDEIDFYKLRTSTQ